MKRKTIALVASLLICISLIGVGFAAWVISAPGTAEVSSQIQVETVTDNRLVVTTPDLSDKNIVFGHPATMNTANAWLTANGDQTENLTVSFDVTVKNGDSTSINSNDLNVTVVFDNDNLDSRITAAHTNGYIAEPQVGIALKTSTPTTGTTLTYTVTITFAWGDAFGGENPYIYFNNKTITDKVSTSDNTTWGDYAKTTLEALETLNNVSIPIVITANYK